MNKRAFYSSLGVSVAIVLFFAPVSRGSNGAGQSVEVALDPQHLIEQASAAEQRRDFTSAAGFYEEYLKAHPDDPTILQRLGLVDCLGNHYDAAIRPLATALRLDPSLWGSALYLGISYYHNGRFAEAIPVLRRSLELKPGLGEAEFWLGSSLLAANQPEAAIPHFRTAAQSPEWDVQAQSLLIKAYQKAAEDNYRQIAVAAPDSYRVHLAQAQLLEWKGINNEAVWEAKQALKRNPTLEGAHRLIAEVYWNEKGFDLAVRDFQAELEINPADGESNLRLGEYWLAKGDYTKALPFLDTAVALSAGSPGEARHFRGEAELSERNYDKAEADLRQATQENPTDPANHQLLAQLYRATGQLQLAAKEDELARTSP